MKRFARFWYRPGLGWWGAVVALTICPAALALHPDRAVKDYRVSAWQVTDGLPYPAVAALAQSDDGYLWVGTRTGLGRFDGARFTTFNRANLPQLTSDRITGFCRTADGTLWIGTGQGIVCYRSGVWTRPVLGPSVDEADILSLTQEADGSLLINGTVKLFRWQAGQLRELTLPGGAPVPRIYAMRQVAQGDVFMAGRGLLREVGGVLRDVSAEAGVVRGLIRDIAVDASGTLWLGTQLGLVSWDGKQRRVYTTRDGLPSNAIRSLLIDRDANLWVGTSNGLARYAHGTFQPLLIHGIDPLSNVLSLFEDRERNLWVGGDAGLYRVQDVKVDNITQRDGLPINSILCLLEAKDGSRWIGTFGGGLAHLTTDGIETYRAADGMTEDGVGALAEDAAGGLWIAYYSQGLSYFKDGKFTHYSLNRAGLRVAGIGVDRHGAVWANDDLGLYLLADGKFERMTSDDTRAATCGLHIDAAGGVWVKGARDVGRFQDGRWKVYPTPKHLAKELVRGIFSDRSGAVWILYEGPTLVRLRGDQREEFPFPVELGPLVYSGFAEDDALWISFRAGVARIPLEEFEAVTAGRKRTPGYVLYNEPDGMRSRAPNVPGSPGATLMRDGSRWFPTSAGIAIIDSAKIRHNPLPPHVVIERVLVDKREYAGLELGRIPPGRGEFEFQFTALSLVDATQVHFRYRLVGFDDDWVEAGQRRDANYGGLRPGAYRFQVIACNNEGVWNEKGAGLDFILLPHFYQRWWFYAMLGLAFVGLGTALYRWRSGHLRRRTEELQRQNDELERRIAERTAELRASYEALRASEYFYHSLVESLPQVIARKDTAGRYTFANAAFSELIGRPTDQIVGRTDEVLFSAEAAARRRAEDQRILELRQPLEFEEVIEREGAGRRYLHVKKLPLYDAEGRPLGVQVLYWDMTMFRETEEKLKSAQKELMEISRLAGIAEMATGVLHNLGNALNSVKVSGSLALEKIRDLPVALVGRLAQTLNDGSALGTAESAARLPAFVGLLATDLDRKRSEALEELARLASGIEYIEQLVSAQQDNARVVGLTEDVPPNELLEYACHLQEASLRRHGVSVTREYMPTPLVRVQRQKVLQVLTNLVRNAQESLTASGRADKRLVLGMHVTAEGLIELSVADNGVGIAAKDLTRIFEFGFTTKRDGHGFGLHSSALAAGEMGGSLRIRSDGPGQGAVALLMLPPAPVT